MTHKVAFERGSCKSKKVFLYLALSSMFALRSVALLISQDKTFGTTKAHLKDRIRRDRFLGRMRVYSCHRRDCPLSKYSGLKDIRVGH